MRYRGIAEGFINKGKVETAVCYDGLQGTEFAHKYKPDLILLDLMLPEGADFMF